MISKNALMRTAALALACGGKSTDTAVAPINQVITDWPTTDQRLVEGDPLCVHSGHRRRWGGLGCAVPSTNRDLFREVLQLEADGAVPGQEKRKVPAPLSWRSA